jgi:hypothetical protein
MGMKCKYTSLPYQIPIKSVKQFMEYMEKSTSGLK